MASAVGSSLGCNVVSPILAGQPSPETLHSMGWWVKEIRRHQPDGWTYVSCPTHAEEDQKLWE